MPHLLYLCPPTHHRKPPCLHYKPNIICARRGRRKCVQPLPIPKAEGEQRVKPHSDVFIGSKWLQNGSGISNLSPCCIVGRGSHFWHSLRRINPAKKCIIIRMTGLMCPSNCHTTKEYRVPPNLCMYNHLQSINPDGILGSGVVHTLND